MQCSFCYRQAETFILQGNLVYFYCPECFQKFVLACRVMEAAPSSARRGPYRGKGAGQAAGAQRRNTIPARAFEVGVIPRKRRVCGPGPVQGA